MSEESFKENEVDVDPIIYKLVRFSYHKYRNNYINHAPTQTTFVSCSLALFITSCISFQLAPDSSLSFLILVLLIFPADEVHPSWTG